MMAKASTCFICGQQFEFNELNEHEKDCLENIKSNDVQYTRQHADEHASSVSSRPESSHSNHSLSNHSASSNDSYEKKYLRCYICGTDVPTYLKGIHEKTCKKNWESGILNVDRRTSVRADAFRSLSRSSSRGEINCDDTTPGGLRKAKSSTLYHRRSSNNSLSTSNDDVRTERNFSSLKSKSVSNLVKSKLPKENGSTSFSSTPLRDKSSSHSDISKKRGVHLSSFSSSVTNLHNKLDVKSNSLSKAKSLQDLRKKDHLSSPISPDSSLSKSPPASNPQYVVCHLCGKLYSQHSITIHVKQCEKTCAMQKILGTNVEYKVKSRSLADLSKGKTNNGRASATKVSSVIPMKRSKSVFLTEKRPTTAPADCTKRNTLLSSSMDSLSFVNKRENTKNVSSNSQKVNKCTPEKKETVDGRDKPQTPSPGLQKCYLCGQLYGTRSLPIHQKQCYIKQERLREQEGQTKRKKKKDIKVIPFGRSKFPENTPTSTPVRSSQVSTPSSRLIGIETSLKLRKTASPKTISNETNLSDSIEDMSNGSTVSSENGSHSSSSSMSPQSPSSPIASKDMMMTCVHCGCQCEPYTAAIHEKVCRKKNAQLNSDEPYTEIRIDADTGLLKCASVDEIIPNGNGKLINCEVCHEGFSSSEIFQHRINCRVSTL